MAHWYNKVENSEFKSFNTIGRYVQIHYESILNYFITETPTLPQNPSNGKIKEFIEFKYK